MGFREWQQKHPAIGTAAAIVTVLLSAVYVVSRSGIMRTRPTGTGVTVYFYDLSSGELFVGPLDLIETGIVAPSGGEGVRAYVYSCSDCADPGSRFIGHLHRFTAERKTSEPYNPAAERPSLSSDGWVTIVQDGQISSWIPAASAAGAAIERRPWSVCREPITCDP